MTSMPPELARRERAPLVGRAAELATLRAGWHAARRGERGLVFIAGEPGIGKTRLAAEVATIADDDGGLVLHGRCDPEAIFPYQPFAQALPPAGDDDPFTVGLDRAALFNACTSLVRGAAREQPVLLVVDDIHWATAPSLALLRHLFRSLVSAPVLLVATYRDTEVTRPGPLTDMLADLRVETGIGRIGLGGLDHEAVGALVDALVTAPTVPDRSDLVRTVLADTGGNPFFIEEVLRDLTMSGVPPRVRDVLATRLARLPGATRQHLAAAAVIGPAFSLGLLGALDLEGDAVDAIEPAVHARLVLEDDVPGGQLRFAHALIRQALLDDLGPTRAARAHARIATALEATDGSRAAIAAHYLASGRVELVERGARAALDAAAAVAWRSAPEAAASLTTTAVDALDAIGSADDALRVRLLCQQAEALTVLQRNPEFLIAAGRAVDLARTTASAELLALALGTRGCYTPAGYADERFITDIEDALTTADELAVSLRARLHAGVALARLMMGFDRASVIEHAKCGAALGDEAGELFVRWIPRFAGSLAACGEPDPAAAEAFGNELLGIGVEHGDDNATCHGIRAVALAGLARGDLDGYLGAMADAEARWTLIGNRWGQAVGIEARYTGAAARGDWDGAEAALGEMLALGATDPNIATVYMGEVAMLRELQGRLSEIAPMLEASANAFPNIISLSVVHGIRVHDDGDPAAAEGILRNALANERFAFPDFTELSLTAWTTQLAAMCGAVDALPDLLGSLGRWSGQVLVVNLGVGILGAVDAYLAIGHAALGDREAADRLFTSALAWEEANGCIPFAERTRRWRDREWSGT